MLVADAGAPPAGSEAARLLELSWRWVEAAGGGSGNSAFQTGGHAPSLSYAAAPPLSSPSHSVAGGSDPGFHQQGPPPLPSHRCRRSSQPT